MPTMAAAGSLYVKCPRCDEDNILPGNSFSVHLSQCPDKPLLWERLPVDRKSNKRARSKAEDNPTINQVQRQLNADIHAAHDDGFSGDMHRIGALPPLVAAMARAAGTTSTPMYRDRSKLMSPLLTILRRIQMERETLGSRSPSTRSSPIWLSRAESYINFI